MDGTNLAVGYAQTHSLGASWRMIIHATWYIIPPAGSHTFEVFVSSDASGMTMHANTLRALTFKVEEKIQPNASNG